MYLTEEASICLMKNIKYDISMVALKGVCVTRVESSMKHVYL